MSNSLPIPIDVGYPIIWRQYDPFVAWAETQPVPFVDMDECVKYNEYLSFELDLDQSHKAFSDEWDVRLEDV